MGEWVCTGDSQQQAGDDDVTHVFLLNRCFLRASCARPIRRPRLDQRLQWRSGTAPEILSGATPFRSKRSASRWFLGRVDVSRWDDSCPADRRQRHAAQAARDDTPGCDRLPSELGTPRAAIEVEDSNGEWAEERYLPPDACQIVPPAAELAILATHRREPVQA